MYRFTTNIYNHMTETTTNKSYLMNEHDFNLYSQYLKELNALGMRLIVMYCKAKGIDNFTILPGVDYGEVHPELSGTYNILYYPPKTEEYEYCHVVLQSSVGDTATLVISEEV